MFYAVAQDASRKLFSFGFVSLLIIGSLSTNSCIRNKSSSVNFLIQMLAFIIYFR